MYMSVFSGDEDKDSEESKQEYTLLCDWVKQQLGDKVAKVQISKRLSSSPCVLVSGKFGWSANMERYVYGLIPVCTDICVVEPYTYFSDACFSNLTDL